MTFRVRLDPDAADVLRTLAPHPKKRIRDGLRTLAEDPRGTTTDHDIKELTTQASGPPAFRLSVGDWRVAFLVRDDEILVIHIFHRRDGYGWMERMERMDRSD